MPNLMQPLIGMQNPQQPLGGLLTAGFNPYPQASLNAGPSGGLLTAGMGPWSQMAYQMAGSPKQGGAYAQVTPPPTPVNTNAAGGSGGGSTAGAIGMGLLGTVLKNPSLIKGAVNGISGLLGGGAADGSVASILAGGSPTLSAVGTGAVAPAVDAAAADAAGALGGADAGAGAAAGGLLGAGAGSGAIGAAGANALAASGGFATGGAAGAGSTAAGAGTLGAAGAAIPLAAAAIPFLIGVNGDKANVAGNAAMKSWMDATGANFKANYTNSGQNTFGTNNGLLGASSNPGTWYDKNGNQMSQKQTLAALQAWAKANGIPLGNLGG